MDIRVNEDFLRAHEPLLLWLSIHVLRAALETERVTIDADVKEALEALVKTYRTLQSGLVYEAVPVNPLAASMYTKVQEAVAEYRKGAEEAGTGAHLRDAEVLGVLAFLQRLEIQHNNGRPRGRAFIDFLRSQLPQKSEPAEAPSIIV